MSSVLLCQRSLWRLLRTETEKKRETAYVVFRSPHRPFPLPTTQHPNYAYLRMYNRRRRRRLRSAPLSFELSRGRDCTTETLTTGLTSASPTDIIGVTHSRTHTESHTHAHRVTHRHTHTVTHSGSLLLLRSDPQQSRPTLTPGERERGGRRWPPTARRWPSGRTPI